MTTIGSSAFGSCNQLTSIYIPYGVTTIGSGAFSGCSSLSGITIPDTVQSIGTYAFSGCSSITSVNIPYGVPTIGEYTFQNCSALTSVTIPSSVTAIGYRAFYNCSSLESLTIPSSVASMSNAFENCSSLTECTVYYNSDCSYNYISSYITDIIIPDGTTTISNAAFRDCTKVTEIILPSGITTIGSSAFSGCTNLSDINIPSSVTYISDSAFSNCSSLTEVEVPDSVTQMGKSVFSGCTSLESVTLPANTREITDYTFYNCSSLENVTIPDTVLNIGYYAFYNCSSLESITIPASVGSIRNSALDGCSSLTECIVYYNPICTDYSKISSYITEVIVPDGVTSINNNAFKYCSRLSSITMPDSITSIGNYSFQGCSSLETITIPENVTSIGNYAFSDCSGLSSITVTDSVTSIGNNAFQNCTALSEYYCYKGSVMDNYIRNNGLSGTENYFGDVVTDGVIDIADIGAIISASADNLDIEDWSDLQKTLADFNRDGAIDGFDASAIDKCYYFVELRTVLHSDNMESYPVNTTISSGSTPYSLQYNGTGNGSQLIINTQQSEGYNGNVLQLQGSSGWASEIRCSFTPDSRRFLVLEADVKPVSGTSPGGINFGSSQSGGYWTHSVCSFGFGSSNQFYCGKNDTATVISTSETYTNGNWYHIKLVLDRNTNLYYTFVNGTLLDSNGFVADSATPEWFALGAGNEGQNTIYYDNVNLYSTDSTVCMNP